MYDNLESKYEEWCSMRRILDFEEDAITRENFLAGDLVSLVCDDDGAEYHFGCIIRDVVIAIADRKTFEYIDVSDTNYAYFIVVVNMLRLDYLAWGTSIRGCWFLNTDDPNSKSSQLIEFCRKAKAVSDESKEDKPNEA